MFEYIFLAQSHTSFAVSRLEYSHDYTWSGLILRSLYQLLQHFFTMERKNVFNIPMNKKLVGSKRKAPQISQPCHFPRFSNLSQSYSAPQSNYLSKGDGKTNRAYITWTRDMDTALGSVLVEQMEEGNKCDADSWKPQALQAVVDYMNNYLGINLTKDNVKNRLRTWKKWYGIVRDVQFDKSGFHWDEDRKMIVITPAELPSWKAYVEGNPDAKSMANKEIYNWDEIVMLCGRDRANGEGVETFDEGAEAMGDETSTHSVQSGKDIERPSTSFATRVHEPSKKIKKDTLATAVQEVAMSVKHYFESKKKNEDRRPSVMVIYEVVSSVEGLTENEIFKATQRLMHEDIQEFELLQGLPNDQKKRWIRFLLNNY